MCTYPGDSKEDQYVPPAQRKQLEEMDKHMPQAEVDKKVDYLALNRSFS